MLLPRLGDRNELQIVEILTSSTSYIIIQNYSEYYFKYYFCYCIDKEIYIYANVLKKIIMILTFYFRIENYRS